MTEKEIEAAREHIIRSLSSEWRRTIAGRQAVRDIDALCAAAREPESLVGKRVRMKSNKKANGYRITGQRSVYRIERFLDVERDDFELLEDGEEEE